MKNSPMYIYSTYLQVETPEVDNTISSWSSEQYFWRLRPFHKTAGVGEGRKGGRVEGDRGETSREEK